MISMEKLHSLLNDLNPGADKEIWDKKMDYLKKALGIKHKFDNKKINKEEIIDVLKRIIDLYDKLETNNGEIDPNRINKIIDKRREENKLALERGRCFRRPGLEAKAEERRKQLNECKEK